MASDAVNASPTALKDLARDLERFQQAVLEASKQASNAISRAPWNDSQKERFAAKFHELEKHNRRFIDSELKSMVKSLRELASRVEAARNVKF